MHTDAITHFPPPGSLEIPLSGVNEGQGREVTLLLCTVNTQFEKMAAPSMTCDSAVLKTETLWPF